MQPLILAEWRVGWTGSPHPPLPGPSAFVATLPLLSFHHTWRLVNLGFVGMARFILDNKACQALPAGRGERCNVTPLEGYERESQNNLRLITLKCTISMLQSQSERKKKA